MAIWKKYFGSDDAMKESGEYVLALPDEELQAAIAARRDDTYPVVVQVETREGKRTDEPIKPEPIGPVFVGRYAPYEASSCGSISRPIQSTRQGKRARRRCLRGGAYAAVERPSARMTRTIPTRTGTAGPAEPAMGRWWALDEPDISPYDYETERETDHEQQATPQAAYRERAGGAHGPDDPDRAARERGPGRGHRQPPPQKDSILKPRD